MSETSQEITKSGFSLTAKTFHWSFVILFAYGISKQINNINQLEDLALLKFEIAFAFLFILFLVVRFSYMTRTQKSSLPQNTPKIQKIAAKSVHYGMYIGMISIALSGLVIGFLYWLGLKSGMIIDIIIGWHETDVSCHPIIIPIITPLLRPSQYKKPITKPESAIEAIPIYIP